MGLFDSLKKLGEDISKEVEKSVGSETFKNLKDAVANASANASNEIHSSSNNQPLKEIPEEYSEFPKFRETATDLSTKETDKYIRCTMNFSNVTEQEIAEYISKINSLGYIRGSNIRFDKGNTYIIVDNQYSNLKLVFHIKR